MSKISDTSILYENVVLGENSEVGDFVLLGVPPTNFKPGDIGTRIGVGALIRSHSVIYAGNLIGINFQSGHAVMIREYNTIGDNVSVGTHSIIEHHVKIGDNVRIHSGAFIPEYSILDDGVWVGPKVTFTNAVYPLSRSAKSSLKGPHLMAGAKVGANATLLPGITIGMNALIGAGSVVVEDVPDGKVVVGNPARIIRDIKELTAYQD